MCVCACLTNVCFFRSYKVALENEKVKSNRQTQILHQIRDVEIEILSLLEAHRDEMKRQNANMEEAIRRIERNERRQME